MRHGTAEAFAAAPSSAAARRVWRTRPVPPTRIHAADDGADVVRILDAVEHHEQRRPGRLAQEVRHLRAHAAPPRRPPRPGARRRDCAESSTAASTCSTASRMASRFTQHLLHAAIRAAAHAQPRDAPALQRLEHRVDAEHLHQSPSAATNCSARSRQPMTGAGPRRPAAAAGARYRGAGRPDGAVGLAGQGHANGMEETASLLPCPPAHPLGERTERLAIDEARRAGQLLRERARHRPRRLGAELRPHRVPRRGQRRVEREEIRCRREGTSDSQSTDPVAIGSADSSQRASSGPGWATVSIPACTSTAAPRRQA